VAFWTPLFDTPRDPRMSILDGDAISRWKKEYVSTFYNNLILPFSMVDFCSHVKRS